MALTKIQSLGITDGTIVNADINASAAIVSTKLSGAGKVLQVVSASYNTTTTTTSSSYTDTGLSLAITPSSASNKILILVSLTYAMAASSTLAYPIFQLVRNSTALNTQKEVTGRGAADSGNFQFGSVVSFSFLDSPATTSSTTYKVQMKNNATYGGTISAQIDSSYSEITLLEIAG